MKYPHSGPAPELLPSSSLPSPRLASLRLAQLQPVALLVAPRDPGCCLRSTRSAILGQALFISALFTLSACSGSNTSGDTDLSQLATNTDSGNQNGDAGNASDAAAHPTGDASTSSDGSMKVGPAVGLTFSGCSPDFSANLIVVAGNGSMAVTRSDAPLNGQIQLHLTQTSGTINVSTAERVAHSNVINLIAGTTHSNISSIMPDPIKGTLKINKYDENAGIADLVFTGVVVENVQTHALCTINGTLVSTGKTF